MKGLLYKLSSRAVISIVTLLLVFAPFTSLTAYAQVGALTTAQATPSNIGTGNNSTINTSAPIVSDSVFANCGVTGQNSISACVSGFIYLLTLGIGSVFAYVAAYFFDITIQLSLNGSAYGLDFISTSWTTARDFANMAFLFILLYIAFTIILRADTGGTMSMLAGVIVVALLVNFSFFFTRVVIDAGNILSLQFYNSIPAPSIAQTIQGSPIAGSVVNNNKTPSLIASAGTAKDLTASLMNMLNIQGLLNNNSFKATGTNFVATIFIYIAGAIILWILTVAFVTNGVKFLFRVVVLWFLIIASPLAFVAAAVQKGGVNGSIFRQWRELLIAHAFYPVAFMFIFLILNNFAVTMSSANGLIGGVFTTLQATGSGDAVTWSTIGAALVSIIIRLVLVIAVIYVAMRASDGIKVYGAAYADKAGNWAGNAFIGAYRNAYLRPTAALYRETVQRQAFNDIENAKKNPPTTRLGQFLDYSWRKNVLAPIAGQKVGGLQSYTEVRKVRDTRREDRSKDWEANINGQLTGIKNREDVKELNKLDKDWKPLADKEKALDAEIKATEANQKKAVADGWTLSTDETTILDKKKVDLADLRKKMDDVRPKREQLISNLEKMEGPQVVALNGKDIESIIQHISEKQLKAVKENLKLSREERASLERKWHEQSKHAPLAESKDQVKKLSEATEALNKVGLNMKELPELYKLVKPESGKILVNLSTTQSVKRELNRLREEQDNIREDQSRDTKEGKIERTKAGQAVKQLDKAIKQIEKLEEKVKEIPKDVGGVDEEGQFEHTTE